MIGRMFMNSPSGSVQLCISVCYGLNAIKGHTVCYNVESIDSM